MKNTIALVLIVLLSACSIFQSTEKETQNEASDNSSEEVYVFDEVSENEVSNTAIKKVEEELEQVKSEQIKTNTKVDVFEETVVNNENQIRSTSNKFYLQFGAFSTLKRAEKFANDNNSKINLGLSIIYDPNTELYTVRSTAYNTKPEVEKIRNDFWEKNLYKDAFIIIE